jgi:hypothetical protein
MRYVLSLPGCRLAIECNSSHIVRTLTGNPEAFDADSKPHAPVDQQAALVELQRLAHDKMKSLLRTRTLRGFPLNVPFTDVEELLTTVRLGAGGGHVLGISARFGALQKLRPPSSWHGFTGDLYFNTFRTILVCR